MTPTAEERLERVETELRRLTEAVVTLVAVMSPADSERIDFEGRHERFVARLESRRQEEA